MSSTILLIHIFNDNHFSAPVIPSSTLSRWRRRMHTARLSGHDIIHVTRHWPLRGTPGTGLKILANEPVFSDAVRSLTDTGAIAAGLDMMSFGSIEMLGVCPDWFSAASSAALMKSSAGQAILVDTIDVDEAGWPRARTVG